MAYMRNKTLLQSNAYLQDPELRTKLLAKTVCTSSSIEGVTFSVEETLSLQPRKTRRATRHRRSGVSAAKQG